MCASKDIINRIKRQTIEWKKIFMFDPWVEKIPWRREKLPTPVFWPGEFHGLYSLWGCEESYMKYI